MFDIATRKATRKQWGAYLNGAAYASVKVTQRENRVRDDNAYDRTDRAQAYLGLAARADLGSGVIGFGHAELSVKSTQTLSRSYGTDTNLNIKELLVSLPLSNGVQVTAGRMRFQDADKWVADSAVDGVHLGWRWGLKDTLRGLDVSVLRGTNTSPSNYALAHVWRMGAGLKQGLFVIAEDAATEQRLHISGYRHRVVSANFAYQINAAALLGDAAAGKDAGFGFDLRATRKFEGALNPQLTVGLAAGSPGYQQTGLHSNKTYDGGQTQVHRYGEVFRPELGNLAVATVSFGLRPSKSFTASLTAHAYTQISASGPAPDSRLSGALSGAGRYLGHEVNLSGAWRPTKKTKVEFGIGQFKPGRAYADRSTSARLFARYTVSF